VEKILFSVTIRLIFILVTVVLFKSVVTAQKNIPIHISGSQKELNALAHELSEDLSKASGMNFSVDSIMNTGNSGIYLIIGTVNPETLKSVGYEIIGNDQSIMIRANELSGLKNGVYNYLYKLGFRFYLPGDIWTHIPALSSVFININEQRYPLFANRSMAGTGGFPYNWVLDPQSTVQQKWQKWLERTTWSSEEYMGGHIGEIFNTKYEAQLKSDTLLLAKYKGKRQWSITAKWCISNAKFVELFVRDRVEAFELQKKRSPERNFISVEPADGGGYCECENCAKIGTVSDQVFFLANQVARAIKERWPNGGVNLYAYSDHAFPPKQRVDDNVYVSVIPYAYQLVGIPEILLSEWRKKCDQVAVYDYWNITDASKDLPKYNYLTYLPQKYGLWLKLGLKGYSLESGYSKFGAGLALYFLSRMSWDKNIDIYDLMHEFCSVNFGAATKVIESMLIRWSSSFEPHQEVAFALDDIKRARGVTKDPMILSRLKEMEDYVYYAAYYIDAVDHFSSPNASQKIENCIRFIWSVYDECLVNTSRIHQFFLLRPVREQQQALVNKWSLANAAAQKKLWIDLKEEQIDPATHGQLLSPIFFIKNQEGIGDVMSPKDIDARFQKMNFHFTGADTLRFNCGKTIYYSFNSGNASSFSFKVNLPSAIKAGALPGVALYDSNKNFLIYHLIENQPHHLQELKFDGLKKDHRYYILVNIQGMLWEAQIPNRAIVIDANNANNIYTSLLSRQKVYFLINSNAKTIQFDTAAFKGTVFSEKEEPLLDMDKKLQKTQVNTLGRQFLIVAQKGSNTLALKAKNLQSLYFFK
jgi:hypothetical protein